MTPGGTGLSFRGFWVQSLVRSMCGFFCSHTEALTSAKEKHFGKVMYIGPNIVHSPLKLEVPSVDHVLYIHRITGANNVPYGCLHLRNGF